MMKNLKVYLNGINNLVAESLGKEKRGILPIISNMPKDNHSVMQFILMVLKIIFSLFFMYNENNLKNNNSYILNSQKYLKK